MSTELHCRPLSDVPVALIDGGTINLRDFAGQKLIVFFCPSGDPAAAEREVRAYQARAADFEHAGAWVIGIHSAPPRSEAGEKSARIHLGLDPEGLAARELARVTKAKDAIDHALAFAGHYLKRVKFWD